MEIKQMSENGLKFLMNNEGVVLRVYRDTTDIPTSSGIYKIISPTGRVYIGQAINLRNRKHEYNSNKCKTQRLLYKSIIKYGIDNHIFSVLELCDVCKLHEREIYYIELYKSNQIKYRGGNGLNLTDGGQGSRGYKHSLETRNKLSNNRKGKTNSLESNLKRSATQKGKPAHINQILSVKGKPQSEDHKRKRLMVHLKPVINTKTGVIYNSAKQAALIEGYNYSTFKEWLQNKRPNKTYLKYI